MVRNHVPFAIHTVRARGRDQWVFSDGKVQCLSLEGNSKAVHVRLLHGEIWGCTVTLTAKRAIVSQVSPTYGDQPHLFDLVSKADLIAAAERFAGLQ